MNYSHQFLSVVFTQQAIYHSTQSIVGDVDWWPCDTHTHTQAQWQFWPSCPHVKLGVSQKDIRGPAMPRTKRGASNGHSEGLPQSTVGSSRFKWGVGQSLDRVFMGLHVYCLFEMIARAQVHVQKCLGRKRYAARLWLMCILHSMPLTLVEISQGKSCCKEPWVWDGIRLFSNWVCP